jgi:hypothetical protein
MSANSSCSRVAPISADQVARPSWRCRRIQVAATVVAMSANSSCCDRRGDVGEFKLPRRWSRCRRIQVAQPWRRCRRIQVAATVVAMSANSSCATVAAMSANSSCATVVAMSANSSCRASRRYRRIQVVARRADIGECKLPRPWSRCRRIRVAATVVAMSANSSCATVAAMSANSSCATVVAMSANSSCRDRGRDVGEFKLARPSWRIRPVADESIDHRAAARAPRLRVLDLPLENQQSVEDVVTATGGSGGMDSFASRAPHSSRRGRVLHRPHKVRVE